MRVHVQVHMIESSWKPYIALAQGSCMQRAVCSQAAVSHPLLSLLHSLLPITSAIAVLLPFRLVPFHAFVTSQPVVLLRRGKSACCFMPGAGSSVECLLAVESGSGRVAECEPSAGGPL